MLFYSAACGCHVGHVRPNNEDNFYFDGKCLSTINDRQDQVLTSSGILQKPLYFGVFDGMGGEQHGEIAAALAADTLKMATEHNKAAPEAVLLCTCAQANDRICNVMRVYADGVMGTTAAMLAVERHRCWAVNLGDSKVFLLRKHVLKQLSVDHNDQAVLEKYGVKNRQPRLTQFLGIPPEELTLEPHVVNTDVLRGDQYLLCSDGLTDMLTNAEIVSILEETGTAKHCVQRLIETALKRGGKDNVTAVLCRVK